MAFRNSGPYLTMTGYKTVCQKEENQELFISAIMSAILEAMSELSISCCRKDG